MPTTHSRVRELPFDWPEPPLQVVLVEPEIAPNTGAITRLCAATGTPLHLIEPLGFRLTDRQLKRAGLDYWSLVDLRRHASWSAWQAETPSPRRWLFSTGGARSVYDADFAPGDAMVFGSESRGLPKPLLDAEPDRVLGIPMRPGGVRSLNLAMAAAIALYEALRRIQA